MLNKTCDDYNDRIKKYNEESKAKIDSLKSKLAKLSSQHQLLQNTDVKVNSEEVKKYENALDVLGFAIEDANTKIRKLSNENSKLEVAVHKLQSSKD